MIANVQEAIETAIDNTDLYNMNEEVEGSINLVLEELTRIVLKLQKFRNAFWSCTAWLLTPHEFNVFRWEQVLVSLSAP